MTVYTGIEGCRSSNSLNALLHEVMVCTAAIIMTILFCNVNIF